MAREKILSNNPLPEDDDPSLRPTHLSEMVGQRDVIEDFKLLSMRLGNVMTYLVIFCSMVHPD